MSTSVSRTTQRTIDSLTANALAPTLFAQSVGFFFAFRIFFVLIAVRVFGRNPTVGVGAELAMNYLLFAGAAFNSIGHAPRTLRSIVHIPCFRWALYFVGVSGLSLLWSSAASLPAAGAFWCAMAADTAIVAMLLRLGPEDEVVNALMQGYIWGACAIAVAAWLTPSQSDLRLGDETYLGPNQIGYVCAFAFFFAQYLMRRKRGNWSVHALLLAVTLLRSLSKTTIIAFVTAQVYILLRDRSISRRTKWILVLCTALTVAVFSTLLAKYYGIYTNAGNQSETLTGRIGIWAYFLSEAMQQPWVGHGFHSVWKVVPPFGPDQFEARHAHNELLQQFYAYGVVGIVMMVAIYSSLFRNLRSLTDSSLKVLFLGMLLFVLVRGLADTEAFDLSMPMWTIVMIGCLIEQSRNRAEAYA
jgi:exopolysaccharide production protein ExoQ